MSTTADGNSGVWEGERGAWAYEWYGTTGPGVIMLHGLMFDRAMWRPVASNLGQDHRVIALDLPGHGASPRRSAYAPAHITEEVSELADAFGLEAPLLVGHSASALLATAFASGHRVRAVVNVDQPLDIRELATRLQKAAPLLEGDGFTAVIDQLMQSMGMDSVTESYRPLLRPRPERETVLGYQAHLLGSPPERMQRSLEAIARRVTVPYHAVFSREPWEGHELWLKELIPTSTCEVYGVEGHFPHLTDVDRFAARVRELSSPIS